MTLKEVLNHAVPLMNEIAAMQQQGLIRLPQKVSYALMKNYTRAMSHVKSFEKRKLELLRLHVTVGDDGRFNTIDVDDKRKEWDFHSKADHDQFVNAMRIEQETEVELSWHKISEVDLMQVDNFPANIFQAMQESGMVTELATPDLKLVN